MTHANREATSEVLRLLSATELAQVNDPNAVGKLAAGEEYLDLEQPIEGVQRSTEGRFPTGRVLPRSAVEGWTWQRILGVITARGRSR
jgi:hypothetical protein